MTPQEQKLLIFIGDHIRSHGYSPTYAQMAEALGSNSKGRAHLLVEHLIWDGKLLRNGANRTGNLRLINPLENISSADLHAELARRGGLLA